MLNQSAEQNVKSALQIEHLLTKDLKDTIDFHINKYGKTLDRKLGLTRDDLINDMREQIWKGILTHDPNKAKGANLKTYLNKLIKNRFGVLHRRSTITKYNSIDYYGDVYSSTTVDREYTETEETGETIFERRQIIMQDKARLSKTDAAIYGYLLLGFTLDEMSEASELPRSRIIGAINRIDSMIKRRLKRNE